MDFDDDLYDEFGNYLGDQSADDSQDERYGSPEGASGSDDAQHEYMDPASQIIRSMVNYTNPAEVEGKTQIVLFEDKNYYPTSTEVFGPNVETLVEEGDTQEISRPIIQLEKTARYAKAETAVPKLNFDPAYLMDVMGKPELVRNIALVGGLHTGKTTFIDNLVRETHVSLDMSSNSHARYTDTMHSEQARGISTKAMPMSFLLSSNSGKSYAITLIDTPGHMDFTDEVSAALRLVDGCILAVDVLDGITLPAEELIRHFAAQQIHFVLFINMLDRLILELKMPPADAYFKIKHIIDSVNNLLASVAANPANFFVSPIKGNVFFGSARYNFGFTLESFALRYAEHLLPVSQLASFDYKQHAKQFYGDVYAHAPASGRDSGSDKRKFMRQPNPEGKRTFVEYILEPIYKIFTQVVGEPDKQLPKALKRLHINLPREKLQQNIKPLLSDVLMSFIGPSSGLVSALVEHLPSPVSNASTYVHTNYMGNLTSLSAQGMLACDPTAPLVIYVSKLYPNADTSAFGALGRIVSGTLHKNDKIQVLGEGFTHFDDEDSKTETVSSIKLLQARYTLDVPQASAGAIVLLEDIDNLISKTATLIAYETFQNRNNSTLSGSYGSVAVAASSSSSTNKEGMAFSIGIFKPLRFFSPPLCKVSIEPIIPSNLPKMLSGLRKLNKAYPSLKVKIEESGEHVLYGRGELYLDCALHDLRNVFGVAMVKRPASASSFTDAGASASASASASVPTSHDGEGDHYEEMLGIKVSDPVVLFNETITETSSIKCVADSANKRNRISMICEPLEAGLDRDIETQQIKLPCTANHYDQENFVARSTAHLKHVSSHLIETYEYDFLQSRSLWSFGPNMDTFEQGPNCLFNECLPTETNISLLSKSKESLVSGFQWASREGPLCDEPLRNVKFRILDASLSDDAIYRGGGQLIPMARRGCYSSFLMSTPRLMEPWYHVEIAAVAECLPTVLGTFNRRRGQIIGSECIPGSLLSRVTGKLPMIDAFGFETDIRAATMGAAYPYLSFSHWDLVPGNPLDPSIVIKPLEPTPVHALAKDFVVKTRRRKGLPENVSLSRFFDDPMLLEVAMQLSSLEM